jgi:hypothetical protein
MYQQFNINENKDLFKLSLFILAILLLLGLCAGLWIENLDKGHNSVIYIPTEAGLPILEAGKR